MIDSICEESSTTGASSAVSRLALPFGSRPRVLHRLPADSAHTPASPALASASGPAVSSASNAVLRPYIILVAACRFARRLRSRRQQSRPQGVASIGACASSFLGFDCGAGFERCLRLVVLGARGFLRLAIGLSTTLLGARSSTTEVGCMTRALLQSRPLNLADQEGASGQSCSTRMTF